MVSRIKQFEVSGQIDDLSSTLVTHEVYVLVSWHRNYRADVLIYNYALTANQIKNIMNEGAAVRFGTASGQP